MHAHQLMKSLRGTTRALKIWNRNQFRMARVQIKELVQELLRLQGATNRECIKQKKVSKALDLHRKRQESIFKQQLRELWLKEGDQNSKFFHTSTMIWRRRNFISTIKVGQEWKTSKQQIAEYFINQFKELYTSSLPTILENLKGLVQEAITEEENEELLTIPIEEESKQSILSLHPLKALSPYGFLEVFYGNYWKIVKEKVINYVKECFKMGSIPLNSNRTFIVFVPKTKQPNTFDYFCPISLCNFSYKIVAKIFSSRMKVMGRLTSLNQGAFLKGRQIAYNLTVAQELMHLIKTHKGKHGLMAMKIDLKKAYDKVEWHIVIRTSKNWGFSSQFREHILNYLCSVKYSLMLNE